MKKTLAITALLLGNAAAAQAPATPAAPPLTFLQYLDAVDTYSLALAAQRESIAAARAGVSIAGVRPDPVLTMGMGPKEFSSEVRPKPRPGKTIGVEWTIETAGKRGKRVQAAESDVRLAEASAEGVRHQAYADAAAGFAEACRARDALVRQEASLQALSDVVKANETRLRAGDVGGLELLQSRTERNQFEANVVRARAHADAMRINLALPLGRPFDAQFRGRGLQCGFSAYQPAGLATLVETAMLERDDARIALASLESARASAELQRANRYVDPVVGVSYGYLPRGRDGFGADGQPVDASPRSNTVSLSLSIPLPFSRLQRGELNQAEALVTKAMLDLQDTRLRAAAEIQAAHLRFMAARDNLARYRDSVLADSQRVLEGIRLSYRNGAASLLELLAAQKSADDAYLDYLQARADLAAATVELQLSAGLRPVL